MSLTYPERTETNFPESVDNLTRMSDLSFEDLPLVQQYYSYYNSGNLSGANALLEANPTLKTKIFNAAKFNKLSDGIGAVQQYFKENLQDYLNEQLTYAEEYNPSTTYKKTNIVSYNGEGFICRKDTSIGIAPINGQSTPNWGLIAKQGAQGVSGAGLSPRGVWSGSTQYYIDDFVAHGQKFWQSLTINIDSEPSMNSTDWLKLVDIGVVDDYIIATDVGEATEYAPVEADKLRNMVKLGNADFDGTKDISVPEMGITPSGIGAAVTYSGTATLAVANWIGSAAPYTYAVTVAGMLDTDNPQIGVVLSHTDIAADDLLQKEWTKAVGNGATATAGQITLYAKEKPTVAIPMFWRGSR